MKKYPKQQYFACWGLLLLQIHFAITIFYIDKETKAEEVKKREAEVNRGMGIHTDLQIQIVWETTTGRKSKKNPSCETMYSNCRDILKYKKVKIEHLDSLKEEAAEGA